MLMLAQMVFIGLALSMLILFLTQVLGMKVFHSSEKQSPFECGFTPWENSRQAFSIQFFLIALIFLIFDIELVILFPFITTLSLHSATLGLGLFILFLGVLTLGFVAEWATAQLEWYALLRS